MPTSLKQESSKKKTGVVKKVKKDKKVDKKVKMVETTDKNTSTKVVKKKKSKVEKPVRKKVEVKMEIVEITDVPEIEMPNQELVEYQSDYRTIIANYDPTKNISPAILTIYEIPLMVGKRATQLAHGARPLIEVKPGDNHIQIAEEELRQKKIPFMIKRTIGGKTEYWKIEDLEVDF